MAVNLSALINNGFGGSGAQNGCPSDPVGAIRVFAKGGKSSLFDGKYLKLSDFENIRLNKSVYPELAEFLGYRSIYYYPGFTSQSIYESNKSSDVLTSSTLTSVVSSIDYALLSDQRNTVNDAGTGMCYSNPGTTLTINLWRTPTSAVESFVIQPAALGLTTSHQIYFGVVSNDLSRVAIFCNKGVEGYLVRVYKINSNNTVTFISQNATALASGAMARMAFSEDASVLVLRCNSYSGAGKYQLFTMNVSSGVIKECVGNGPTFNNATTNYLQDAYGKLTLVKRPGKDLFLSFNGQFLYTHKLVGDTITWVQNPETVVDTAVGVTAMTSEGVFYAGSILDTNSANKIRAYRLKDDGTVSELDPSFSNFYAKPEYYSDSDGKDWYPSKTLLGIGLDTNTGLITLLTDTGFLVYRTAVVENPYSTDTEANTPIYLYRKVEESTNNATTISNWRIAVGELKASGYRPTLLKYTNGSTTAYVTIGPNGDHFENFVFLPCVKQKIRGQRYTTIGNNTSPYDINLSLSAPGDYYIRVKP